MLFNIFSFKWPELPFDELKKRTRVLIIDDETLEYISLFKDDGYAIDKWDDIKKEKITELEKGIYDIILLDIQGVGKDFSQEQGFGLLKHLKNINPAQIIIAYSNADYNLKYQNFFNLANDTIDKASDFYRFKEIIDKNIYIRFSYDYYYSLIEKEIEKKIDKKNIQDKFNKSLKNKNADVLIQHLKKFNVPKEKIAIILQLVNLAIKIYQIMIV